MHTENIITIRAPLDLIFDTVADLSRWSEILPHYRWIRYLEQTRDRNVVVMAARRGLIPIHWTSEQVIDRPNKEIRFHHLKAFTKGMDVVWSFDPGKDEVVVRIRHDLRISWPLIGTLVAKHIIGSFFVSYVAQQTLIHLKRYLESHGTA